MVLSHIILSLLILKELLDKWENSLITKERKPVLLHIMLSLVISFITYYMYYVIPSNKELLHKLETSLLPRNCSDTQKTASLFGKYLNIVVIGSREVMS